MKKLNPTVIHLKERFDRLIFINNLKKYFPRLKILEAIEPKNANIYYDKCDFGAGCTASQLMAIDQSNKNEPLLVLEDDAVIDIKKYEQFLSLEDPPKDCGIILLGGDFLPKSTSSWTEVTTDYCGGHAMIYMPIIHKTKFLENAWKYLFFFPREGPDSWITEAIMRLVIKSVNLKIYRPNVLPFTAGKSISSRSKKIFNRDNKEI